MVPNNQLDKYLSTYRNETLIQSTQSNIIYPQACIDLQTAFDSVVKEYEPNKYAFLAAGVMQNNETDKESNLFNTVFGRDSLIMLGFLRSIKIFCRLNPNNPIVIIPPSLERDNIVFLAQYQGQKFDSASEEEFGKILHEYRDPTDPIAIELYEERGWVFPYFGGIDSTFHFVEVLSKYLIDNPQDLDFKVLNLNSNTQYTLHQVLNNAIKYCLSKIDNGLVKYTRLNSKGIEIQSWRDSFDSISDHNGLLPDFSVPLCLLDIQLVALESLLSASHLILMLGDIELYSQLMDAYNLMNLKLIEELWVNVDKDNGYLAMGSQIIEGKKVLFDSVSSSNLIALKYDFIPISLKYMIFSHCYPKLKVANGISTLSTLENRYHISGYHTGNVWVFDNVLCIMGLLKINKIAEAKEITECIDLIVSTTNCYPELVGSIDIPNSMIIDVLDVSSGNNNRICQPGQPLQGWSVLGYIMLKTIFPKK
jgi:glycogen debranching enzyme